MKKDLAFYYKNFGLYLWPVLALVAIFFVFVNFDMPQIEKINSVRKELSGINEKLAALTLKSQKLSSVDSAKMEQDLEKVDLVLPDNKDASSIIRNLEFSSSVSGVLISDLNLVPGKIATSSSEEGQDPNELPFKITVVGKTDQMLTFLQKISTVGRALDFESLEVNFNSDSSVVPLSPTATPPPSLNLTLATYYLQLKDKIDSELKNVESPLPELGDIENIVLGKIYRRELLKPSANISPSGKSDLFK